MIIARQTLEKTIEYLNKYSSCFKKWELDSRSTDYVYCDYMGKHVVYPEVALRICSPILEKNDYYILKHINSEFRIAYNIIKDLAHH